MFPSMRSPMVERPAYALAKVVDRPLTGKFDMTKAPTEAMDNPDPHQRATDTDDGPALLFGQRNVSFCDACSLVVCDVLCC